MKKLFFILLFCFSFCTAYAQTISSSELISNAKQFDGKMIYFAGEVIGDIMVRGQYAWINVNDSKNAVGIWLDKALVKDIIYTGGHDTFGDVVEISGIFNRACLDHGGDLDIHAQGIKIIKQGHGFKEAQDLNKLKVSFVLLGIIGGLWILMLLTKR